MRVVVVRSMTSGLQETRWDGLWLAVTLSVCVTDIDAGCVTEYTRDCFLFAVWPVLIALCIARHLISHWKWPQMAADSRLTSLWSDTSAAEGCLQSYSRSFSLLIQYSQFTMFDWLLFFLLDTSSHLLPELLIEEHKSKQTNRNTSQINEPFVWFQLLRWKESSAKMQVVFREILTPSNIYTSSTRSYIQLSEHHPLFVVLFYLYPVIVISISVSPDVKLHQWLSCCNVTSSDVSCKHCVNVQQLIRGQTVREGSERGAGLLHQVHLDFKHGLFAEWMKTSAGFSEPVLRFTPKKSVYLYMWYSLELLWL